MENLKLEKGDKVPVIRTGPMTTRKTTWQGKEKIYYDNLVRVVSTGEEMIWSHGSEGAQQRLDEKAGVGDAVVIHYMRLESGNYCYSFESEGNEPQQAPPSTTQQPADLKAINDRIDKMGKWAKEMEDEAVVNGNAMIKMNGRIADLERDVLDLAGGAPEESVETKPEEPEEDPLPF